MWNKKRAPKVRGLEIKASSVGEADWETNVNTGEHLAYIGEIPLEQRRSSCVVGGLALTLEHVFDRNAKDITRAVGLQGLLQGRLLVLKVVFVDATVNTKEDFKISFGLLNGLQNEGGLVAFGVVEPNSGCDL